MCEASLSFFRVIELVYFVYITSASSFVVAKLFQTGNTLTEIAGEKAGIFKVFLSQSPIYLPI